MQHEFVTKFIEDSEERGSVTQPELEAIALEHDLDEAEVAELVHELEVRGVERIEPEDETATETEAARSPLSRCFRTIHGSTERRTGRPSADVAGQT